MKQDEQESRREAEQAADVDLACELCGRFGAFRIGGRVLCETCYSGCGSCCPEFGKDDLWTFPEERDEDDSHKGSSAGACRPQ